MKLTLYVLCMMNGIMALDHITLKTSFLSAACCWQKTWFRDAFLWVKHNTQTFGQSMWGMTCSFSQSLVLIQLYPAWAIWLSRMDENSTVRIWTTDKDLLTENFSCNCCQMGCCFVLCGKKAEISGCSLSLKLIWRHVKHWSMCHLD